MTEKRGRYNPQITLGNIITFFTVICSMGGFWLTDHDTVTTVKAEQIALKAQIAATIQREVEWRREVLQRLADMQVDVREIRQASGVSWRELPPSRYQK